MTDQLNHNLSMQSYLDENKEKLDESLVSLRFMKEVDEFLLYKNLTNRDFSCALGYTESYISQLMSGVKKINVSFINKLENCYNVKFDVKIHLNDERRFLRYTNEPKFMEINISINTFETDNCSSYSFATFNNNEYYEIEDAKFVN